MPGGKLLLKDMEVCEKVLMIPDTSIIVLEEPHLRPDHEVDLSVLSPSLHQGELQQDKSLYPRCFVHGLRLLLVQMVLRSRSDHFP